MKRIVFAAIVAVLMFPSVTRAVENHEYVNSVVWIQTAGEYQASTRQAYELAKILLDQALLDTNWTAASEQTGNYQSLPPAVCFDIDETVLNNSPYAASLIRLDDMISASTGYMWEKAAAAKAIPGAVEFCQYAVSKGVKIFYICNRTIKEETATLANLKAAGLPIDDAGEHLLLENEQSDWGTDKTTRRAFLAQSYRILLLVGDDLNDVVAGTRTDTATRNAVMLQNKEKFGTRWITIVNSVYGGWESAIYNNNNNNALSREERLQIKYEAIQSSPTITPPGTLPRQAKQEHELLSTVLWIETAGEYDAVCAQSYELAKIRLDEALADPNWTAADEQTGAFQSLQPAVILSVDETTLNNELYEGSLIRLDSDYTPETWAKWISEKSASAIPGAVEFCQYADSKGVRVFYVTNRTTQEEADTLANLKAAGFPIDDAGENLLTVNEHADWDSDKTTRRAFLAQNYRILLLAGNDLNDFVAGTLTSTAARNAVAEQKMGNFGKKWIILPNSMYGGWEEATYNRDYTLTREQKLAIKYGLLDVFLPILSGVPYFELFR